MRYMYMNVNFWGRIILAFLCSICLTGCDKDENGYYLSPNYCTATINGEEYIHRESYALPMNGHFPSAELYDDDFYVGGEVIDVTPVMIIKSPFLKPKKESNDIRVYSLTLYIKNIDINDLDGKKYSFTETSFDNLYGLPTVPFEIMWKENINIAIIECEHGDKSTKYTATGHISFKSYDKESKSFDADVVLDVDGDSPVNIQGRIHTSLF